MDAHTPDIWPTFDDFYDAYDKKRGRPNAEKWWGKLTQKEKEDCMAAIPAYIQANPNKVYRKDPERYLRHKAFYDEVIAPARPAHPIPTADNTHRSANALAQKLADRQG